MTTRSETTQAACPLDRKVRQWDNRLTTAQNELLKKAPCEWGKFPGGIGCTSRTLAKLEKLGLVETSLAGIITPGESMCSWRWRLVPN